MRKRIEFDHAVGASSSWVTLAREYEVEREADKLLESAGITSIANGYMFNDPLRAAAVLRLAGFEVLPWE